MKFFLKYRIFLICIVFIAPLILFFLIFYPATQSSGVSIKSFSAKLLSQSSIHRWAIDNNLNGTFQMEVFSEINSPVIDFYILSIANNDSTSMQTILESLSIYLAEANFVRSEAGGEEKYSWINSNSRMTLRVTSEKPGDTKPITYITHIHD